MFINSLQTIWIRGKPYSSCILRSVYIVGHQMVNLKVVALLLYVHALFKAHLSQKQSQCSHIKHTPAHLFMPYSCPRFDTCTISDLYLTQQQSPCIIEQPSFHYAHCYAINCLKDKYSHMEPMPSVAVKREWGLYLAAGKLQILNSLFSIPAYTWNSRVSWYVHFVDRILKGNERLAWAGAAEVDGWKVGLLLQGRKKSEFGLKLD